MQEPVLYVCIYYYLLYNYVHVSRLCVRVSVCVLVLWYVYKCGTPVCHKGV